MESGHTSDKHTSAGSASCNLNHGRTEDERDITIFDTATINLSQNDGRYISFIQKQGAKPSNTTKEYANSNATNDKLDPFPSKRTCDGKDSIERPVV